MKKIVIGAPSPTGKDVHEFMAANFDKEDAAFPVQIIVTNLTQQHLAIASLSNILEPASHRDGSVLPVSVPNTVFMRLLVSTIEQLSGLYGCHEMVLIEVLDPDEAGAGTEAKTAKTKNQPGAK